MPRPLMLASAGMGQTRHTDHRALSRDGFGAAGLPLPGMGAVPPLPFWLGRAVSITGGCFPLSRGLPNFCARRREDAKVASSPKVLRKVPDPPTRFGTKGADYPIGTCGRELGLCRLPGGRWAWVATAGAGTATQLPRGSTAEWGGPASAGGHFPADGREGRNPAAHECGR